MINLARPIVGRAVELARLRGALGELGAGPMRAFSVVGEPGIGKSRLLAEVAAHADGRGDLVFAGRAAEFERDFPFGAFVDALDAYLGSLSPGPLRALSPEQRAHLAAIFPSFQEPAGAAPGALQHERYRSHYAVRVLIELLARRRPCVLLLDDMHWADSASLELVSHLLRRRPNAPVVLLMAFRRSQAPHRLATALDAADREGTCEQVELGPLSRSEADQLLDRSLRQPVRDQLYEESGGNPFYLEQLARAAGRGGSSRAATELTGAEVPHAVIAALNEELALLSVRSRRVLEAAAVAGDPFSLDVAAEVAGVPEEQAMIAADESLERGLVQPTEVPREFRFRHPIVRRAVYESAREAWRIGAHARAAGALGRRGASVVARAHHVERSAQAGDEAAVALLTEAGHASAPLAPSVAAGWFRAALRLLSAGEAASERRLELLVPLARALGSSGQLEASRETLGEVVALLPPEMTAVRGQVIAFMSLIQHLLGNHGEARAPLLEALQELPDQRSPEAAALQAELAADCFFLGEWTEMEEWAERARRLARGAGDRRVHAAASALLGLACYELTRIAEARAHVAESKAIVDSLTDDELALRVDACHWLGWCEHLIDHYEDSVAHMRRGIAISRQTGQGHMLAPMTIGIVIAMTWQGRLAEASSHADQAVEVAHLAGSHQLMAWALTMRCWVDGRLGRVREAIRAGEEAARVASAVTRGPYTVVASCWLAEARLEAGAPGRGRDELLAAVDGPDLPNVEHAFRSCIYELLTRLELALGRAAKARDWARRAEAAVDGLGLPGRAAFALRALAAVALAEGDCGRAAELALESADAAGDGYRIEAARSRLLGGTALAAAGAKRRAIVELERALSELDACGAARDRDRAARELRRLGRHVARFERTRTRGDGLAALSPRELEVAELVWERLTNRQIAERLVLSEKTVERHLSHVFHKLEVGSRVEVARRLEQAKVAGSAQHRSDPELTLLP